MSPLEVVSTLSSGKFSVKPSGELNAMQEIERVIVGKDKNLAPVYLKDINLKVSRRYREPFVAKARYGDAQSQAPCIVLSLIMKEGANIVELGEDVKKLYPARQRKFFTP